MRHHLILRVITKLLVGTIFYLRFMCNSMVIIPPVGAFKPALSWRLDS